MKRQILVPLVWTAIIIIGISSTQGATDINQGVTGFKINNHEPRLEIMQAGNALNASDPDKDLLLQGWNQYVEDLNYSSFILDQYVNKNYTSRTAMAINGALMLLDSQTLSAFGQIKPQEKYWDFHNFTLNGIKYFNSYLWYMGKYYETSNPAYIMKARDEFNKSHEYYLKSRSEIDFF